MIHFTHDVVHLWTVAEMNGYFNASFPSGRRSLLESIKIQRSIPFDRSSFFAPYIILVIVSYLLQVGYII